MPRIIGIDLGTTNTAVAILEGGRPRVIEDDRGYKVLPSVLSAKGDGRYVVGQAAHNLILTRPDRTVYGCKRLMGRRFDSPEVQAVRKRVQFDLREAEDGGVQVQVGDQWMTPPEVAAVVLQVARTIAERALGDTVEEAVITVPAHFNHAQRKATMEAATLAGLRCERLLNEPTAAALAYGHRKQVERTVAVFDLGGGTFDISVLHLQNGIYEILATSGDTFLGGDDFDWRIAEWLADGFQSRTGVDVRQDRNAVQRLKDAAERAKCELSFADRANIVIPQLTPQESIDVVLGRSKLEELTVDLVERACDIARQAVADAGLQMSDLDEVILVGGQTRMPRVRDMVAGVFGRDPSRSVHPEEAVAVGAAVHAANLADVDAEKIVLLDVTPFDLGIDTARGLFVPIIERNSRVPASSTRTFATVHDQQTEVRVTVRQGQSRLASENEFLGEFMFEGLTPAPRLHTKVDVAFRIDSNGMLHVSATERGSGERRNITIRNYAEHAQRPAMPDSEQARLDAAQRSVAAGSGAAAAAGAGAAAVGKKKGILDSLFGRGKRKEPAAPAAAASAATAASATAAAAAGAAPTAVGVAAGTAAAAAASIASSSAPPRDARVGLDDGPPLPMDEPEEAAALELVEEPTGVGSPPLAPLDEEVLYEESGAAAGLGIAGHGGEAPLVREEHPWSDTGPTPLMDAFPMSVDELFGPADPDERRAGDGNPFERAIVAQPNRATPEALSSEDLFGDVSVEGTEGIDVLGDEFAMLDGAALDPAVEPMDNPFGEDDHTQIDEEALAATAAAAATNLAAQVPLAGSAEAGSELDDLWADGPDGADGVEVSLDPETEAEPLPELHADGVDAGELIPEPEPEATAEDGPEELEPEPLDLGAELDEAAVAEAHRVVGVASELVADAYGDPEEGARPTRDPDTLGFEDLFADESGAVSTASAGGGESDPFASAAPEAPAADPFAEVAPAPASDPFAAVAPAPASDPFAEVAPAPAADPFAEVAPAPASDPFAEVAPAPASDPFAEAAPAPEPAADMADALGLDQPDLGPTAAVAPLDPGSVGEDLFGAESPPYEPPPEPEAIASGFALVDQAAGWAGEEEVTKVTPPPVSDRAVREPIPLAEAEATRRRKPARVKLNYRDYEAFVVEYRENLRRGGTFIRTERPLPVGRECLFELGVPGLDSPLVFPAVVTFVATAAPGQEAGMGVEYQLDDGNRRAIERVLARA